MEVGSIIEHSQYALPVIMVLLCAILVFTFGFKKAEQPPFAQLSGHIDVDKKVASKKRAKAKEKKIVNSSVVNEKTSPAKKSLSIKTDVPKKQIAKVNESEEGLKEQKQENNKTSVAVKKEKIEKVNNENRVEHAKNKKNLKNSTPEKPVDYDDGDWEQAYSRKDKKNKKKEEETPLKKNKKTKKADIINEVVARQNDQEKPEIKDKTVKETENKELKEKDEKEVILESTYNEEEIKEDHVSIQEIGKKMEKSGKEDRKNQKPKKSKKISEIDIISGTNPAKQKSQDINLDMIKTDNDVEKKIIDNAEKHNLEQSQEKPAPVFDELSELWTEAKPPKKSKKKARKDN